MSGELYKCLGIVFNKYKEDQLELLLNILEKIYFYNNDKLYSKEEIEVISTRLNIDVNSSFVWTKQIEEYKIVCGGISILQVKESKYSNPNAIKDLKNIGFIFGSNAGIKDLIPDENLYQNVFKKIKMTYNLHLQDDFTFIELIGQVYEIVLNNKIDNKVAITFNNKL